MLYPVVPRMSEIRYATSESVPAAFLQNFLSHCKLVVGRDPPLQNAVQTYVNPKNTIRTIAKSHKIQHISDNKTK